VALEEEIGDDPVLHQLLPGQEEFFDTTDETANSDTETAVDEEVTDEPSEEVAVPAPKPAAGLGLGTILSGGAAIVLGIGFALFMLLKKKKKGVSAEAADAPPTPTAVADGPLQKSERLEKALASMDEKTEG